MATDVFLKSVIIREASNKSVFHRREVGENNLVVDVTIEFSYFNIKRVEPKYQTISSTIKLMQAVQQLR